jgi:putative intracellular protease/amidase
MKKALIVVTSHDQLGKTGKKTGWYLPEVTHIYYPLLEAGFEVDFASTQGGAAPLDQGSYNLEDPLNQRFVEGKMLAHLEKTLALKDVNASQYQVIAFAGGHGTMWDFPNSEDLNTVTAQIYENGGIVAAVCHGPAALVNVKLSNGKYLVDGKDVNSFTDAEEIAVGLKDIVPFMLESTLKSRGARFHAGANWENKVVVSERLITGQNPQSAHSLGLKIVEVAKQSL